MIKHITVMASKKEINEFLQTIDSFEFIDLLNLNINTIYKIKNS